MNTSTSSRRIHILRESVIRLIAAGEVIERPASVVRELIDNSIDADSKEIDLYIEDGGTKTIRTVDNGGGMEKQDLELCIQSHATSKIETSEDIYHIRSLGFRGEALSSIAACSKLDIVSMPSDSSQDAYRLIIHGGKTVSLEACPGTVGTVVNVSDLFYTLPGRRKFLKSVSSETSQCRIIFLEKALANPDIGFRLFVDKQLKLFLPASGLIERISQAYKGQLSTDLLHEYEDSFTDFSIRAVLGDLSYSRRDRRMIQVFVNGRRIQDFSLTQAITYGYSEFLPGGSFPAAFVYIEIDPALVDFNIHPAKREVRFRNMSDVHQCIVRLVRFSLQSGSIRTYPAGQFVDAAGEELSFTYSKQRNIPSSFDSESTDASGFVHESPKDRNSTNGEVKAPKPYRYIGQLFGLFLLVEYKDKLLVVDQHAAHERVIFERIRTGNPIAQNLLLPIVIEASEDESLYLESIRSSLKRIGIEINRNESGKWHINKLPQSCLGMEKEMVEFLRGYRGDITELEKELFADLACKAAIKDGEQVEPFAAEALINEALSLANPRCPHGRPIWFELTHNELFQLVGRT